MCFLANCFYHIILTGDIEELVHNLDAFCFNYQDVDGRNALFKNRLSGKIVVESGQLFW